MLVRFFCAASGIEQEYNFWNLKYEALQLAENYI
jgi:hypothetical protein